MKRALITGVTGKDWSYLANISTGYQEVLELGNLNAKRDWGHTKDFFGVMWLMLQQDKPEDYVIATGQHCSVCEFVKEVALYFGMNIVWDGDGIMERGIDKFTGKTIVKVNVKYF
jgi:GDPmannose 4,6-dehydratase